MSTATQSVCLCSIFIHLLLHGPFIPFCNVPVRFDSRITEIHYKASILPYFDKFNWHNIDIMHLLFIAYPCTFPGCNRMFGVRSNAKRHLRTHGVFPDAFSSPYGSSAMAASTSKRHSASTSTEDSLTQPYVVSFHQPIIVGNPATRTRDEGNAAHGAEESADSQDGESSHASGSGVTGDGETSASTSTRPPFFKLRWLPPSVTSRTSAAALRYGRGKRVHRGEESTKANAEERESSGEASGSEGKSDPPPSEASPWDGSYDEGGGQL